MNYLAHLFLSGSDPDLLVGNFIADSVRGAQGLAFPARVQQGIWLHRQIDTFTDAHPVVAQSKARLRPGFRKYAGVVADVFYDHFLARHFSNYSLVPLPQFAQACYRLVYSRPELLPPRVHQFLPYMVQHDWLTAYAQIAGISQALNGLSRRTTFASGMEGGGRELEKNYALYEAEFQVFFPELQSFVASRLPELPSF